MTTAVEVPLFAQPDIEAEQRPDGTWVLRSRVPLESCDMNLGSYLRRWATERPDVAFLCERDAANEWRTITYREAWDAARAIGQALLERGLGPQRTLMALSGNSIDHALVMLGCFVAGVPFVAASPAYSLQSTDFAKLRHEANRVNPGVLYVAAVEPFAGALAALAPTGAEVVTSVPSAGATSIDELRATTPGPEVDAAYAAIGPDTIIKYLFTSGSTGLPKGVVNTHRMLCSNQQARAQILPFTTVEPPVLVDWLPWSHTFGGNNNFNLVLVAGGTMYIDAGRPAPGLIETTVANLRDVSPTVYFNVPAGFAALLPFLEQDDELARSFFARLRFVLYAAAALPQDLWDRIDALGRRITGGPVTFTAAWGSTETAPMATAAHFPLEGPGNLGVPIPGTEIKLVPNGRKLELRVKGPNVMPGYLDEPELTEAAFDEDGFYCIGDAGKFASEDDPTKGIVFDGRVAEDFKLTTGTWVSVGTLRPSVVGAAAPLLQDVVITGQDCDWAGAIAWVSAPAANRLFGLDGSPDELVRSEQVRDHVRDAMRSHNDAQAGSSTRIARMLLVSDPPAIDHNEITDKGYINQRAVLEHRADAVARIHAEPPDPDVLVF